MLTISCVYRAARAFRSRHCWRSVSADAPPLGTRFRSPESCTYSHQGRRHDAGAAWRTDRQCRSSGRVIANGTDEPYLVEPDQIFAINEQGQRIMPVTSSEAIEQAGSANSLKAGLTGAAKNAAIGAVVGAATGAAIGAAVGTIVLSPAQGALVGAAIGGSVGAAGGGVYGGAQGQAAAHHDAETQISALSLQTREAHPNYSVNGYVFFPKGEYTSIQMTLLNEETHQTDTRTSSWQGGEIATGGASAVPMSTSPATISPSIVQPSPARQFQEQQQSNRIESKTLGVPDGI